MNDRSEAQQSINGDMVFKTKTGHCHVLPDKILLTRSGTDGKLASILVGNNISRILIIYSLIAIGSAYLAYSIFQRGEWILAIVPAILAAYLIRGIVQSLRNSATPEVERRAIQRVEFRSAVPGVTRAFFEVYFKNSNGRIRKRLIMLPGSMTGGPEATARAVEIMTKAGLITAPS